MYLNFVRFMLDYFEVIRIIGIIAFILYIGMIVFELFIRK